MLLGWSLVIATGVYALRTAGFRFRWEAPAGKPADERTVAAGDTAASGARVETSEERVVISRGRAVGRAGPEVGEDDARSENAQVGLREDDHTPSAEAPAPASPSIRPDIIDFETYPDGRPACDSCPVRDEYGSWGVLFSFRSWTAGGRQPYLVDAGSYLPERAERPHGIAPAVQERGLEVGVIRMDFPRAPVRVVFDLTGPDLIDRFQVTAWTPGGRIESDAILRRRPRTFHAAGGGVFRQESVTIESATGIDRVELDGRGPPGYLMLVDNLSVGRSALRRPDPR